MPWSWDTLGPKLALRADARVAAVLLWIGLARPRGREEPIESGRAEADVDKHDDEADPQCQRGRHQVDVGGETGLAKKARPPVTFLRRRRGARSEGSCMCCKHLTRHFEHMREEASCPRRQR
jgi:hypothetical protein